MIWEKTPSAFLSFRSDNFWAMCLCLHSASPNTLMDHAAQNKIVSFIWGIADDVLRDLFKRGKYPDVILPMFTIR
jgi:hypothetical protein